MAKKSPGSVLKAKGLIPQSWDLRSLNRGQKSWITKQSRTFSEVVKKPGDYKTISAKTKSHRAQLKGAGIPVTNQRGIIKTGAGGHVSRRGNKLTVIAPDRKLEVWFANHKNFESQLARARGKTLGPNQVWTLRIGDNTMAMQYRSLDALLWYAENKSDWHTEDGEAPEHISLVLITVNRSHIIESLSDTPNASKEARSARRPKTSRRRKT